MNEIQTGRHNRFIQKLFDMKGEPPAPQLSSEIMMVHPLFHGVENRHLESWDRFGASTSLTSVAAQFPAFRFRNPSITAGTGIVAVIEKLTVSNSVAVAQGFLRMFVANPPITTDRAGTGPVAGAKLDGRTLRFFSRCTISGDLNAALPAGGVDVFDVIQQANVPYDYILDETQQISCPPGWGYDWIPLQPGAQTLTVALIWRERQIEPSELLA